MTERTFTRRALLRTASAAATLTAAAPWVVRAQRSLELGFTTIPDPDGWHPSLRLKGDWLVFEISDGVLSGYGEASHSRDDDGCRRVAVEVFARHYANFDLSLESLRRKEAEIAQLAPDFVTATAYSGINQALYDLLAKREQVPVWQLFTNTRGYDSLPLYTTINRALTTRNNDEYLELVADVVAQGFGYFKCAPFEAVDNHERALEKSAAGLRTLDVLRQAFPDTGIRVDFHERFTPADFHALLPELERVALDWIEEPFQMGPDYAELRRMTKLRVAAGELFWGGSTFQTIWDNEWADVIMPDVKHVGGFGPLLEVLRRGKGKIEISPHNPSGPISTAASLHAGALFPDVVRSLEYAFDKSGGRRGTGERVEGGSLYLSDRPGWGVEPA